MAGQDDEFKIKGAASRPSSRGSDSVSPPKDEENTNQPAVRADNEDSAASASNQAEQVGSTAELEDGKIIESIEELAKFKWMQSDVAPDDDRKYYYNSQTFESSWNPPDEPFLIWDCVAERFCGLQNPPVKPSAEDLEAAANSKAEEAAGDTIEAAFPEAVEGMTDSKPKEEYTGYNPKIHGNYDPNADYAKYHERKRAEEAAAAANPYDTLQAQAANGLYETTMTLNRFTGNAQAPGHDPDRHSDFAKSGRQMNAFFDVEAAANSHEGRSLKAERRSEKVTKKQVQKFNEAKQQKKRKKQMAFLLS